MMKNLLLTFISFLRSISPYGHLAAASLQSRMEYRGSFFIYIFTLIGFYVAQVSVIAVMLYRFKNIGGWSAGEIAFLYSLLVLAQSLTSLFFSGMIDFDEYIREGTFDRILLRPLSPLSQILASRFELGGVAHFILAVVALSISQRYIDFAWSFSSIFFLMLVLVGATLILAGIRIAVASVAFFTVSNKSLQHLVVYSSREFLLYPADVYSKPVRFFLTFIFPIAFINFYPAHVFLHRVPRTGFEAHLPFLTFPVGVFIFAISLWIWNRVARSYTGTGT